MGAGDGNGPREHEVLFPCNESTGHAWDSLGPPLPKPPAHVTDAPQQASDPANYAIAGKILLAVAGAFAGVLLALVALHLYNSARRRRLGGVGGGGQRRLVRSLAIAGADDEDRRDGEGAVPSPRGLDSAVLAAIPVVMVDAGTGSGRDCAVCLAELEAGEKARVLPRCGHRFHVECIDAWFRGNATCPLCRADVVVVVVVAPEGDAAPSAPPECGAQPEVRIDVAGDAAVAAPANGSAAAPVVMGRLHSGTDLDKARRVFASTRFSSF